MGVRWGWTHCSTSISDAACIDRALAMSLLFFFSHRTAQNPKCTHHPSNADTTHSTPANAPTGRPRTPADAP